MTLNHLAVLSHGIGHGAKARGHNGWVGIFPAAVTLAEDCLVITEQDVLVPVMLTKALLTDVEIEDDTLVPVALSDDVATPTALTDGALTDIQGGGKE